jgi:hypothetical protein
MTDPVPAEATVLRAIAPALIASWGFDAGSDVAFTMRFADMDAEAEAEMAAWRDLGIGRKNGPEGDAR